MGFMIHQGTVHGVVLALWHISCQKADALSTMPSSAKQQVLSLNHMNNRQHLAATVVYGVSQSKA
jgi:hypothetical protein